MSQQTLGSDPPLESPVSRSPQGEIETPKKVCTSSVLLNLLCPVPEDAFERVRSRVMTRNSAQIVALRDVSLGTTREPCGPLIELLNAILDACREEVPAYYHGDLQFYVPGNGDPTPLDGYAIKQSEFQDGRDNSSAAYMFVVVSDSYSSALEKADAVARSMKKANKHRAFIPGLLYHHPSRCLAFVFLHHSGSTASPQLGLTRRNGVDKTIRALLGMMYWEDAWAAGYVGVEDLDRITLQGTDGAVYDGVYKKLATLFQESSVTGRATRAILAVPASEDELRSSKTEMELPIIPPASCQEPIVMKFSWIHEPNWDLEKTVLEAVSGMFGVPEFLFGFNVKSPRGKPVSTKDFLQGIRVRDKEGRKHLLQIPPLLYMAIGIRPYGLDLITSPGLRSLVEAVLHAMIGHMSMFMKGWLHCDVSHGNILRLAEPKLCERNERFPCTRELDMCTGMLIDGDLAIKWNEIKPASSPRGTMPYMSIRKLDKNNWPIIETAIDDLESFIWVLLSDVLAYHKGEQFLLTGLENSWQKRLDEQKRGSIVEIKTDIADRYLHYEDQDKRDPLPTLSPIKPLLREWFALARDAEERVQDICARPISNQQDRENMLQDLESLSYEYYEKYLNAALEPRDGGLCLLEKLPDSWCYFPTATPYAPTTTPSAPATTLDTPTTTTDIPTMTLDAPPTKLDALTATPDTHITTLARNAHPMESIEVTESAKCCIIS